MRASLLIAAAAVVAVAVVVLVVQDNSPRGASNGGFTVFAVGDIGQCDSQGDEATGQLLRSNRDAPILVLGDLAYPDGSTEDFARCYQPSWGGLDDRVRPVPGNHEYDTKGAAAYFDRYGDRAGARGRGWYSFDLAGWHIVALNSNCEDLPAGGCSEDSEQVRWLRADLARSSARCTLAYWHHAVRSSGRHGDSGATEPLRLALVEADADVVLAAHDHHYERYAPRDGLREWVVGTGGASLYEIVKADAGSEVRYAGGHGVLELNLHGGSYDWRFRSTDGGSFEDSGSERCH